MVLYYSVQFFMFYFIYVFFFFNGVIFMGLLSNDSNDNPDAIATRTSIIFYFIVFLFYFILLYFILMLFYFILHNFI
jgi:hypothetical protein